MCLRRIFLLTERDGSSTVSQRGGRTTVFFLTSQVFFLPKIHREAEEIQCPSYRVTTESQCSFYLVSVFFLPRNNRESEEIQCPSYRVAVLFLPRIHREAEELQCSSYPVTVVFLPRIHREAEELQLHRVRTVGCKLTRGWRTFSSL